MDQLNQLDGDIENTKAPNQLSWEPPRWLTEDYEGMEEDIAEDIYAAFYWRMRKDAESKALLAGEPVDFDNDLTVKARLISQAVMNATQHADKVQEGAERAFFRLLWSVQKNGFFRTTGEEFETISEWLVDRIPKLSENSGQLSDIMYLINHVFPLLERIQNGWRPPDLMKIKDHWTRMRVAVPYLRELTRNLVSTDKAFEDELTKIETKVSKTRRKLEKAKTEEEKQELKKEVEFLVEKKEKTEKVREKEVKKMKKEFIQGIERTFRVIQNPNIPVWGPTGVQAVLRAGKTKEFKKFQGYKALLSDREVLFSFIVPEQYTQAVESLLRNLIEIQLTDGKLIVSDMGKAVLRKDE